MSRFSLTLPDVDYLGNFPVLHNSIDDYQEMHFVRYGSRAGYAPFHCFVDDWRLESIWRDDHKQVDRALLSRVAIAPDYSVYAEYPYVLALYQIWRSRVVASWWAAHGVYVVPVLQWTNSNDPRILDYFQGLSGCDVVAVRCPGNQQGVVDDFKRCAEVFLSVHRPKLVLHFGLKRGSDVWPRCQIVPLNSKEKPR